MAAYGATLLRLILGVIFLMHAYFAVVVFGFGGMVAYQAKYGIPFPEIATVYLILAHGLGGLCLIVGLFTRWAALANAVAMLGALLFVHLKNGFWAHSKPDSGYEYVLVLLVVSLAVAMIGGGALALRR